MATTLSALNDALVTGTIDYHRWLRDYLVDGPDCPIPQDAGGPVPYLADQLSRVQPGIRAAVAEAAAELLVGADSPSAADLLEVLSEVAPDNPAASVLAVPVVAAVLAAPAGDVADRARREALHLLSRCPLPGVDWLPLIRPHLATADITLLAYLALARQHPALAPPFLPGVLATAQGAGVPTGLFLFKLNRPRQ